MKARIIYSLYLIFIIAATLFGYISYRAYKNHQVYVSNERWPLGARKYNEKTGYEMAPGFTGTIVKKNFKIKSHRYGYRIAEWDSDSVIEKGGGLFVGCSFTYGDEVNAENTFCYQVKKETGKPTFNFGVCSYSYSNVVRQLEYLSEHGIIDSLQPQYLVLGAGDWMIERSLSPFYPTSHLQLAYPFITKKEDNTLTISNPPSYIDIQHIYDVQTLYMKNEQDKSLTFERFVAMCNLVPRVYLANYFSRNRDSVSITSFELYDFVLTEIKKITERHKIKKIIVLWMPSDKNEVLEVGLSEACKKHGDVVLVNGKDALDTLNVAEIEYTNRHPSPMAHSAYAKLLIDKISKKDTIQR